MKQRNILACLPAIVLALLSAPVFAQSKTVQLEQNEKKHEIAVKIGDEVFTVFHLGSEWPKPFASPVYAPGKVAITRPIPEEGAKVDHKHHKGIWISVDEVNEIKFWAEQGKIQNISGDFSGSPENPATLGLINHWLDQDGKPVVEEKTKISIYPNRLMIYDITFKALDKPVTFADTKEGLFGIRLIDVLRETETGKVTDSEGRNGTKEAWGKTADWVDYFGQVEGKTVGAAIFDHPDNFRPSRYHVRNYGLFSINPFGEQAYAKAGAKPITLEPGETLNLKYGIYIHAGDTKAGKVAEVYQDFVKHAKK